MGTHPLSGQHQTELASAFRCFPIITHYAHLLAASAPHHPLNGQHTIPVSERNYFCAAHNNIIDASACIDNNYPIMSQMSNKLMLRKGGEDPMALIISAILYGGFFINVLLGAFFDAAILSDVGELLTMLTASLCFVIGILIKESQARKKS